MAHRLTGEAERFRRTYPSICDVVAHDATSHGEHAVALAGLLARAAKRASEDPEPKNQRADISAKPKVRAGQAESDPSRHCIFPT